MTSWALRWLDGLGWWEAAAWFLALNVLTVFAAVGLGEALVRVYREHRIAPSPPRLESREVALAVTCTLLNTCVTFAGFWMYRTGHLSIDDAGVWRALLDALVLLLVMDVAMYATHRLAHLAMVYRLLHGPHHRYDRPRPLTLFALHPLEVVGFGGLWLGVISLWHFSLAGMVLYLVANTTFGTLGHIGVEPFPRRWIALPVLRHVTTSTFHAAHHMRPSTNFGFYTDVWDGLFGTLDPEYRDTFLRRDAR